MDLHFAAPPSDADSLSQDVPHYSDISDASTDGTIYTILPPPTPFRDPTCDITDFDPTVTVRDLDNVLEFGAWETAQMHRFQMEEDGRHLSSYEQQMIRYKFEVVQETVQLLNSIKDTKGKLCSK